MNVLKEKWKQEEDIAYIKGWDFSHINNRYEEDTDFGWDYLSSVKKYLNNNIKILDIDTGGGEILLSLNHPYHLTSCTEGYQPNIELCKSRLLPLGIDFKACDNPKNIPFESESFDVIINRHGSYDISELHRLLKKGGLFITQQVGSENDRDLVEMVLPGLSKPYPTCYLDYQVNQFKSQGFEIVEALESFRTMKFFDIGAFVWFARIIQWEFVDFSVDRCFDRLLNMHQQIEENGYIAGTTHRYFIIAKKI